MTFFGYISKFAITYFSMLLHELGHIASAVACGKRVDAIKFLPVGLNASIEHPHSRVESLIIFFCGPLINVLLAIVAWFISRYSFLYIDNVHFFMFVNIYMAIFNLIPMLPLDGGKLLREVMALQVGLLMANKYIIKASTVLALLLVSVGVVQLFDSYHNFSLFSIGLYIFFSLKSEKSEAALMNIKNIIYRRSRLMKKGVYGARDLVVIKSMHLGDILRNMDFDKFHFIHILDDDMKLLRSITEQELVDAMLKYNSDITFREFIELNK
jgi:stage IV sporulation protein FB